MSPLQNATSQHQLETPEDYYQQKYEEAKRLGYHYKKAEAWARRATDAAFKNQRQSWLDVLDEADAVIVDTCALTTLTENGWERVAAKCRISTGVRNEVQRHATSTTDTNLVAEFTSVATALKCAGHWFTPEQVQVAPENQLLIERLGIVDASVIQHWLNTPNAVLVSRDTRLIQLASGYMHPNQGRTVLLP